MPTFLRSTMVFERSLAMVTRQSATLGGSKRAICTIAIDVGSIDDVVHSLIHNSLTIGVDVDTIHDNVDMLGRNVYGVHHNVRMLAADFCRFDANVPVVDGGGWMIDGNLRVIGDNGCTRDAACALAGVRVCATSSIEWVPCSNP